MKEASAITHGLFGRIIRGVILGLPKTEMLEPPVPRTGSTNPLMAGTISSQLNQLRTSGTMPVVEDNN
ncbi:conserved hypothetical protein [Agrobacterium fabrum str. J-07]|nr:conserved hypothetical protein [Agrobacterium fabrum str. J-07]